MRNTQFMLLSMSTEIQSKRQERKRRSTANPAYSGLLETEVLDHSLLFFSFFSFATVFMSIKCLKVLLITNIDVNTEPHIHL